MSGSIKHLKRSHFMRGPSPFARLQVAVALLTCLPVAALAQMAGTPSGNADQPAMDHSQMHGAHHSHGSQQDRSKEMDHGTMDMGAMQGGSAPADARDPDAYSDGLAHGPMTGMDMIDNAMHSRLMLDRLEYTHDKDANGMALEGQAWIGTDLNKLWLKAETERSDGHWGTTRAEALWDHAIAPYWSMQSGLRNDSGDGPDRTWAALGVSGLAPYWFEIQATAYAGESGRTAFRLEAEYDLLLTQRLILQPLIELNAYGKSDADRGIGSGLADMEAGLRLRYEVSRKFAPYVGVTWHQKFGGTADYARDAGKDASETKFVAGVRLWF